jgi:hypothetical protein
LPEQTAALKISPKDFRVREGETARFRQWPTKVKSFYKSDDNCHKHLAEYIKSLKLNYPKTDAKRLAK